LLRRKNIIWEINPSNLTADKIGSDKMGSRIQLENDQVISEVDNLGDNRKHGTQGWAGGITGPYPVSSAIPCTSPLSSPTSSFHPSIYLQPPITNNKGSPIGIAVPAGNEWGDRKSNPKDVRW